MSQQMLAISASSLDVYRRQILKSEDIAALEELNMYVCRPIT